MTRKDFQALAVILANHRNEMVKAETNGQNQAIVFSCLMSDVRAFCRERNPNFDSVRFDDAVFNPKD